MLDHLHFFLIQMLIINQNANTDICHCKSPRDFIFTKITNPTGQDPLMEASEVLSFFLHLVRLAALEKERKVHTPHHAIFINH